MAADRQPPEPITNGAPPPPSRIVVSFPAPGAADGIIRAEGVTPGQIQAAAWLLDQWARELRGAQLAKAPSLAVPTPTVPPDLRRT